MEGGFLSRFERRRLGLPDGFCDRHQHYFETTSFGELADEKAWAGTAGGLNNKPNEYALVVVDESQALRSADKQRARVLRCLLLGHAPRKLALVSAALVGNSLWDLYFNRQDATFAAIGVRSLKERFPDAVSRDPDDLKSDPLFDILDATTVRHTRQAPAARRRASDLLAGPRGSGLGGAVI